MQITYIGMDLHTTTCIIDWLGRVSGPAVRNPVEVMKFIIDNNRMMHYNLVSCQPYVVGVAAGIFSSGNVLVCYIRRLADSFSEHGAIAQCKEFASWRSST